MSSYKGTIIESSLKDKKILDEVKIVKKYKDEDWVLYDIEIEENKIKDLQKYINDGPWYRHLWNGEKIMMKFMLYTKKVFLR
ncbi:MAG: hypothetical protein AAB428_02045 [Patescibacteria group bacterium]